ncbi:uncharacterized protein LOC128870502 [Anastrepha ludens]|uniref:uncharacterized protein LOC128870502 n=1 Tax=Anastrepha ludens TaxID=28586 RepID=UPI0023AF9EA3|nr:uncharacterized protein LOC128870502 [Anastrepha ludens]
MNRRIANNTFKTSKQPKLTAFITNKSNETSSVQTESSSILSKPHSSTAGGETIDSTTLNVNVVLKATTGTEVADVSADAKVVSDDPTGIELPNEIELIAKEYIDEILSNNEKLNSLKRPEDKKIKTVVLIELYKVRQGMEKVYNLFASIETFPSGTAVCESSFSVLTRIRRPQRISMSTDRLNNLSFLAY